MRELPVNYGNQEFFYKHFYEMSRGNLTRGSLSLLWRYPHRVMEKKFRDNTGKTIVEMGFGFGEHLTFVRKPWKSYVALDINTRETWKEFESLDVKCVVANAISTGLDENLADRVIATCLLAHLQNPELALREWNRVTKRGGVVSIYVPCEGGIALKMFRKLISERHAAKNGFQGYRLFILREHINSFQLLNGLIKELFEKDEVKRKLRPVPWLPWFLNLFCVYEIRVSK